MTRVVIAPALFRHLGDLFAYGLEAILRPSPRHPRVTSATGGADQGRKTVCGWLAARSSIWAIQAYAEPSDEHEDWSKRLGRLALHFWLLTWYFVGADDGIRTRDHPGTQRPA
jgi:hypothetical protein